MPEPSSSGIVEDLNSRRDENMDVMHDSDEANTSTSRVHLGAFGAKETDHVLPQTFKTPARPIRPYTRENTEQPVETLASVWDTSRSAIATIGPSSTPTGDEGEWLLEEPSSVLGSRIMRALDNPSPPPKIAALPPTNDEATESQLLVDIDQPSPLPPTSTSFSQETTGDSHVELSPFTNAPARLFDTLPPVEPLISLTGTPKAEEVLEDLMIFDSPEKSTHAGEPNFVVNNEPASDGHMAVEENPLETLEETLPETRLSSPGYPNDIPSEGFPAGEPPSSSPPLSNIAPEDDEMMHTEAPPPLPNGASTPPRNREELIAPATAALERLSLSPPPRKETSPPRVRRSARLSATPRTPALNIVKKRTKRATSPLKAPEFLTMDEGRPATPVQQLTPAQLPPLPRGLHIVKKSASKAASPLFSSEEKNCDRTPQARETSRPTASQMRRKGKACDSSIDLQSENGCSADIPPSPLQRLSSPEKQKRNSREPDAHSINQRLRSLSPDSHVVVDTLVTKAVEEIMDIPPLAAPDFSTEMPAEGSVGATSSPLGTPQRPARVFATPTKDTHTSLASSRIVTSPARVASPARSNSQTANKGGIDVAPKTPIARRVLVSETVYAGTPMAYGARSKSIASGAQTGKTVPPSPAMLMAGIPSRKPMRIPLKPSHAETDPAPELTHSDIPPLPSGLEPVQEFEPTDSSKEAAIEEPASLESAPAQSPSPMKNSKPRSKPSGLPIPTKSFFRVGSPGSSSKIPRTGAKPYTRPISGTLVPVVSTKIASTTTTAGTQMATSDTCKPAAEAEQDTHPTSLKRKRGDIAALPASSRATSQTSREAYRSGKRAATAISSPNKKVHRDTTEASQATAARQLPIGSTQRPYVEVDDEIVKETPGQSFENTTNLSEVMVPPLPSTPTSHENKASQVASDSSTGVEHQEPDISSITPMGTPDPTAVDLKGRTVRRTSRTRKSAEPNGTAPTPPAAPSKPAPAKRRATTKPTFGVAGSTFNGMTDLALKSLTLANTTRNQRYFASLETEIVRREGDRPESPGMKIQSIAQRERDERSERAARRARRGSGANEDGEEDDVDMDEGGNLLPELIKHQRGAREDEEYQTPVKGEPALKRARLGGEENQEAGSKKGIRWNRALFTEAWLDEVIPQPKTRTIVPKKGILAPSAKNLPLDSLGNPFNADTPVPDMQKVHIIVQKFVYDNDLQPELASAPAPAPPKRATRSRKSK